jgi:ubiquinone/menaquinone biosynthesis C-methylase UbiE
MSDSSQTKSYAKQDRGSRAAYEAYFAGMDSSVQQKIALTTAHFPVRGRVADMGSGSGRGTFDLARLYEGLELIGVDINPVAVAYASEQYKSPNLRYVVGDISEMVFDDNSLDGILDSSVLHHVTSFNNFDINRIFSTFDNQVRQLKAGGVIIIRDFVRPDDADKEIYLDLPEEDGASHASEPKDLSTAALFELFAQNWRSSANPDSHLPYARFERARRGFARYRVLLRYAAEFVLRKDYRADWETELLEEYTYLSQPEFEREFRSRGLRIVASMPIWNPWIVQNRFEGHFYLSDLEGNPLPFPPTNYLIVGEKVGAGTGVKLSEQNARTIESPQFLNLTFHRHIDTGYIYELAERPNLTVDLLPWFESEGQIFVLAKKDFPRPVVNACSNHPSLNRSSLSGYITEPISAIVDSSEASDEIVYEILAERAKIERDEIIALSQPFSYYTSPGGVNERVTARLIEISSQHRDATEIENYTKFTDAGTVREMDAHQTLRACHVGGMFDARLEINIYRLLRSLRVSPGTWIGAPVKPTTQKAPDKFSSTHGRESLVPSSYAAFEIIGQGAPRFLSLREGIFVERDCEERTLAAASFEYVMPRDLSRNTIAALPVVQTDAGIFVGIEHRDLPAVQTFTANSRIAVAPAWRLPVSIKNRIELKPYLAEVFARDFGANVLRSWELGGSYFPTPGVTPEIAYPFVVEIESSSAVQSCLRFIEIRDLSAHLDLIEDAHLLIAACRLCHALGALNS